MKIYDLYEEYVLSNISAIAGWQSSGMEVRRWDVSLRGPEEE